MAMFLRFSITMRSFPAGARTLQGLSFEINQSVDFREKPSLLNCRAFSESGQRMVQAWKSLRTPWRASSEC
jgi:hypothetical protein